MLWQVRCQRNVCQFVHALSFIRFLHHSIAFLMFVSGLESVVRNINLEINIDGKGILSQGSPRLEAEILRPTQIAEPSENGVELSHGDPERVEGLVAKELYCENLQEPLIETDVLEPIEREELPIPLKELNEDMQSLVAAEVGGERDKRHRRDSKAADIRSTRCPARRSNSVPPAYGNQNMFDECPNREPNFDLSWMTCDANIKDWTYKKHPAEVRLSDEVRITPSPSFKNIMENFWQEQTGAGFLALFNEVLEIRRDIRMRMIRAAEAGQLSKSGLLILRDEQLISEALLMGVNGTGSS